MLSNEEAFDLMQRAKAGEEPAFALLYEHFYVPIFRYIYGKISEKHLAEDLAQTVFMKAFTARKNFSSEAKVPIAYFFTIARNLLIDHYRKHKEVNVQSENEEDSDFFAQVPENRAGPHEQILEKEKIVYIQDLLSGLKPEHREVLELKFLKELSNKKIAETTGKSEDNVRQIQVRALRKIKDLLIFKS